MPRLFPTARMKTSNLVSTLGRRPSRVNKAPLAKPAPERSVDAWT
jgi:hypothetical protein